jgi:urease accessory protein
MDYLPFLRLLQLADSTLPIGAMAHSFGLESLVAEGALDLGRLELFLRDYLEEVGILESWFCLRSYQLASHIASPEFLPDWLALNQDLSALKTARESRQASAALGRRFLQLAQGLEIHPRLPEIRQAAKSAAIETHYSLAFGLISCLLDIDEMQSCLAYLHQLVMGLISACQRLMPLGQSQASQLLWSLKPAIRVVAQHSKDAAPNAAPFSFTPLVETASMRHPALTTRLFIS